VVLDAPAPGPEETDPDQQPPSSDRCSRLLDIYRWGLLPHWAKSPKTTYKMINAKAETLSESSAYRVPFRQHRCLIVVDGFFEWRLVDPEQPKKKAPYYFRRSDGAPITFAGLYETWWDKSRSADPDPETLLRTCAIITTEAGADMVEVHNRMPVILEPKDIDTWLDSRCHDTDALRLLLSPAPGGTLLRYPISRTVNSPRNDGPELLARLTEAED